MEEIIVTIPRERPFGSVAGLVLGGVAARHELTLDALDDLQLAVETLLDRGGAAGGAAGEVTLVLRVDGGAIDASMGPFARNEIVELEHEADGTLGMRRLLDTVVDSVRVRERDGDCWVELRKEYGRNAGAGLLERPAT